MIDCQGTLGAGYGLRGGENNQVWGDAGDAQAGVLVEVQGVELLLAAEGAAKPRQRCSEVASVWVSDVAGAEPAVPSLR